MFEFVYKYRSLKALRRGLVSAGGRNFTGKLALLRRSGPKIHWSHCFIDNSRVKKSSHVLLRFDFNSFRNCYLMLVYDFQFGLAYHKTVSGLRISQVVADNIPSLFGTGSSIALKILSPGQIVSNINPGVSSTCKYGRAPGSKVTIVSFEQFQVLCKLPSGDMKRFSLSARGLLGPSSTNPYKFLQDRNKAGFHVYRGFRPTVRGVAKNPVDHPHGGGEGKKSPRVASRSPWGWVTLVWFLCI